MKTAELTGAALDYWVAKAAGVDAVMSDPHRNGSRNMVTFYGRGYDGHLDGRSYMPSVHWSDGGEIIERELIGLLPVLHDGETCWMAAHPGYGSGCPGSTPLMAAMRAFVASKFGGEVDDRASALEGETMRDQSKGGGNAAD